MIDNDYTEEDRWDWDQNDPRQICRHGSFIGSWWGPDIMCFKCEMGEDPTVNEMIREEWSKIRRLETKNEAIVDFASKIIPLVNNEGKTTVSHALVEYLENYTNKIDGYKENIEYIKNTFGPFSDDWEDDRNVLYKAHRHEIDEFYKRNNKE
jgi:hypothetical protein